MRVSHRTSSVAVWFLGLGTLGITGYSAYLRATGQDAEVTATGFAIFDKQHRSAAQPIPVGPIAPAAPRAPESSN